MKYNVERCTCCNNNMCVDEVMYYGHLCSSCESDVLCKLIRVEREQNKKLHWTIFIVVSLLFIGIITIISRSGGW